MEKFKVFQISKETAKTTTGGFNPPPRESSNVEDYRDGQPWYSVVAAYWGKFFN